MGTLEPLLYQPVGGAAVPPVPADVVRRYSVLNAATRNESLVGTKKCVIAPESLQLAQL
jgi:hypothetical protein